jgi:hypothetical protein
MAGAPASSARRRRQTRGSGVVWRLSNVSAGEMRGALGVPKGVHAGQLARLAGPGRAWPRRRRRRTRRGSADGGVRAIARVCGHGAVGPATMAYACPSP